MDGFCYKNEYSVMCSTNNQIILRLPEDYVSSLERIERSAHILKEHFARGQCQSRKLEDVSLLGICFAANLLDSLASEFGVTPIDSEKDSGKRPGARPQQGRDRSLPNALPHSTSDANSRFCAHLLRGTQIGEAPKTTVQNALVIGGYPPPSYTTTPSSGGFVSDCQIYAAISVIGNGRGPTIRAAETQAAANAIQSYIDASNDRTLNSYDRSFQHENTHV